MKCPFCQSPVVAIPTASLFIAENDPGRIPTLVIYDENLIHYACQNSHRFFACSEVRAEADFYEIDERSMYEKRRNSIRKMQKLSSRTGVPIMTAQQRKGT